MSGQLNLRDSLMRQEGWTKEVQADYEKEIRKMIKTPLSTTGRTIAIIGCIGGLTAGIALALLFFQENTPVLTSVGLGIMSVGGFSMAAYCGNILWAGGVNHIRHGLWHALHLASLSTLFLVMALVKICITDDPGTGFKLAAIAACVQWVLLAVLPVVRWVTRMRALEHRQAELFSEVRAQQGSGVP